MLHACLHAVFILSKIFSRLEWRAFLPGSSTRTNMERTWFYSSHQWIWFNLGNKLKMYKIGFSNVLFRTKWFNLQMLLFNSQHILNKPENLPNYLVGNEFKIHFNHFGWDCITEYGTYEKPFKVHHFRPSSALSHPWRRLYRI